MTMMPQTIFSKLEEILKKDERLASDDGRLLKNKAVELANKLDEDLIKVLFASAELKDTFFKKVGELTLFDKDLFIEFVSNKEFLPDSYTAFKNKIGLAVDRNYLKQDREVTLVWPYKDCVLEGGQTKEEAKRGEIFWNTTLAPDEINRLLEPKVLTNWKRYDKENPKKGRKAEQILDTDNLIIKGNNLLALHSIKKRLVGKVKLIYIDPPYNTGSDTFKYNDSFNHSSWLTFMQSRLEIAKELLAVDGAVVVQCDDNEQAYLRVLMDEIFGRENFINCITVKMNESKGLKNAHIEKRLPKNKEYLVIFAKSKGNFVFFPKRVPKDNEELEGYVKYYKKIILNISEPVEKWKIEKFKDDSLDMEGKLKYKDRLIYLVKPDNEVKITIPVGKFASMTNRRGKDKYYFNDKGTILSVLFLKDNLDKFLGDLWLDISTINTNKEGGIPIMSNGQKPEYLIKKIVEMTTQEGDLVLDFFAGTGTTGAVAHKMSRQYVLIEQMDYIHDLPEARLQNVIAGDQTGISKAVGWKGGGSFAYAELMPLNEKFVREIEAAKNGKEVLKIWEAIQKNGFVSYRVDPKKFDESAREFTDLDLAKQKKFVLESLDANMLYVNYSDIGDKEYGVGEDDKKLNGDFYASSRV